MAARNLHISPQELRTIAAGLKRSGVYSEELYAVVERAWACMDSGWDGYAETDVVASYRQVQNEQSRTIAMLSQMVRALEAIADVIEAADLASRALFDPSAEWGSAPGLPGDVGRLPPRQGGGGSLPPLPEDLQPLLGELLTLLATLPPGTSMDDLLTLLDGQPVAIAFQLYLGASGAFNPGAVAVSSSVYVAYNFQTHELSLILGDEAALGVAGGAGTDVSGGGGVMFFYNIQSNDAFNGGCTNFTTTLEGALGPGAEAHANVTVMYNPGTGEPIVGVGVAGGPTAGVGGAVSATISVPGMNNAVVLWTIEDVDLASFSAVPMIINDRVIGALSSTVQQAALIPLTMSIIAASSIRTGAGNVVELGEDIWSFFSSSTVNTSPFPAVPVQTPTQTGQFPEQTPTLTPTPPLSNTQEVVTQPVVTPGPNPTPAETPTP